VIWVARIIRSHIQGLVLAAQVQTVELEMIEGVGEAVGRVVAADISNSWDES